MIARQTLRTLIARGAPLYAGAALLWLAMAFVPATAQNAGFGLGDSRQPVEIFADQGIEWHQDASAYVARGNARAVRADTTVYAQTLTAYYRKGSGGPGGSTQNGSGQGGGTQVYRVDADGAVRIVSPSGTAYGDKAVFDVDKGILVMTGSKLRLITPRETITARDTLEYWQQQGMAVARGDAVAVSDDKRIAADLLTAYFSKEQAGPKGTTNPAAKAPTPAAAGNGKTAAPGKDSDLDRMYAYGNVVVTTPEEVARGDRGVYNARTGIAVLTGAVKITRDKNQLNGSAAEMNFNTNVSRIIAGPGAGGQHPPVRALIIPNSKDKSDKDTTGKDAQPSGSQAPGAPQP
jgi:lipopolysaccharide export system protein LptA